MRESYVTSSVLKLTIVEMKLSRIIILRIDFQSVVSSPSSKHMDSSVNLTPCGGLFKFLISTKFCFLIDFTARQEREGAKDQEEIRKITLLSFLNSWFNFI